MYTIKKIVNITVLPSSFIWKIIFLLLRLIYKFKLKKVNTTIHYIATDDWMLILTPLAGSSSVNAAMSKDCIKAHNLRKPFETKIPSNTYILGRDFDARLTSFYNKKVRNPTSIAKANLLASCSPLKWTSSPTEFLEWEGMQRDSFDKDKHLYTDEFLGDLLGVRLSDKVNSTEDVAIFAHPIELPFDRLSKSHQMYTHK